MCGSICNFPTLIFKPVLHRISVTHSILILLILWHSKSKRRLVQRHAVLKYPVPQNISLQYVDVDFYANIHLNMNYVVMKLREKRNPRFEE